MLERRSERLDTFFFNFGLVHASRIIVSNLLFRASVRCFCVSCSRIEYLVKHISVFFLKDFGNAPTWKGSRDRIRSQPAAVSVLIKICACRGVLVETSEIETMAACLTKNGADQEDN